MHKNTKIVLFGIVILGALFFSSVALVKAEDATTSTTSTIQLVKPAILPDSPLYFFKRLGEGFVNLFTFGKVNQAKRALDLSQVRLAESQALLEKNKTDLAQKAGEEYQTMLGEASQFAKKAQEAGKNVDDVLVQISQKTLKNQQVLLGVLEKAPEEARSGLQNAIQASFRERQQALEKLPEQKRQDVEAQDFDINEKVQNKIDDLKLEGLDMSEDLDADNELEQIENEINKLDQTENVCQEASDCGKPLICTNGSIYPAWSCSDGKCNQIEYFRDPCSVVSSTKLFIKEILPPRGMIGSRVTIYGNGFSAVKNTIMFSYGAIPDIESKNGTTLTFTVPEYLNPLCSYQKFPCLMMSKKVTPGKYEVLIKNDIGTSNSVTFEVTGSEPHPSFVPSIKCKEASDCGKPLVCKDGKTYPAWACGEGNCNQILYARYPCESPSLLPPLPIEKGSQ